MHVITSPQNSLIKQVVLLLKKSRERKKAGLYVAEGIRELEVAAQAGLKPFKWLTTPAFLELPIISTLMEKWGEERCQLVSDMVFSKISYREGVPNVVALFPLHHTALENLQLAEKPLLLVADRIEKPGNLGAMLRTADAAGVDAVLITDPLADLYNPNVLRNSLGSFYTHQLVTSSAKEAITFLKSRNIPIVVTWLEAAKPYYQVDFSGGAAMVLGTEATGVDAHWVEAADSKVIIPMYGRVDSLNVSNAAAIVLFEAIRQLRG
jgi:TrmH family RNA methyltransferase